MQYHYWLGLSAAESHLCSIEPAEALVNDSIRLVAAIDTALVPDELFLCRAENP